MPDQVEFRVNVDSPIAVYIQIENQVQFAIASGRLRPGDTLPSVREMSMALDINPNTVTKAYRDLALLGLVNARRGVGVTVVAEAPKVCRQRTLPMAKEHLRDAVAECLATGLKPPEIRKLVTQTIDAKALPYEGGGR